MVTSFGTYVDALTLTMNRATSPQHFLESVAICLEALENKFL